MVKDHKGNIFESKNEMYKYYNLRKQTVKSRLKMGWSLEQSLTTPTKRFVSCLTRLPKKENESKFHPMDHLGNNYKHVHEYPKYWGIDPSGVRIDHFNRPLEKALTTHLKERD